MKRTFVAAAVAAAVGVGLVVAAGMRLTDEGVPSSSPVIKEASAASQRGNETGEEPAVRVRDALVVVNKDGSAAIGASLNNATDVEVSLLGIVVSVEGRALPVNGTEMWLPVPASESAQVGAASDAGGFVVPDGVGDATRAGVEFHFDDGRCVLAEVSVVARTGAHRHVYPRTGKRIGPVVSDEVPGSAGSCRRDQRSEDPDESGAVWELAPGERLTPTTSSFTVLVTRIDCNGGVTGEVVSPRIVHGSGADITLTFGVKPGSPAMAQCPGNKPEPFEVELDAPVGGMALIDGHCAPGGDAERTSLCEPNGIRWPPSHQR